MKKAIRILLVLVVPLVLLIAACPLLLYAVALSNVDGRPERPSVMAGTEEQSRVWRLARGVGAPTVETTNPYGFVLDLWNNSPTSPGDQLAHWVASSYLAEHRPPHQGMWSWHFQNAALSIWLTRHWTAGELLTAAFRTERVQRGLERNSTPRAPSPEQE